MPRIYKRNSKKKEYKKYDPDVIQKAIIELDADPKLTYSNIANKYNMHRSVLYRHSHKTMKSHGGQPALDYETEDYLIKSINKCADWGFPINIMHLRYIVKIYLDKLKVTHAKFKNNFPGPDFIRGLLKRHKDSISKKITEKIKRGKAALTLESIQSYYNQLHCIDNPESGKNDDINHQNESALDILKKIRYGTINKWTIKRKRQLSDMAFDNSESDGETPTIKKERSNATDLSKSRSINKEKTRKKRNSKKIIDNKIIKIKEQQLNNDVSGLYTQNAFVQVSNSKSYMKNETEKECFKENHKDESGHRIYYSPRAKKIVQRTNQFLVGECRKVQSSGNENGKMKQEREDRQDEGLEEHTKVENTHHQKRILNNFKGYLEVNNHSSEEKCDRNIINLEINGQEAEIDKTEELEIYSNIIANAEYGRSMDDSIINENTEDVALQESCGPMIYFDQEIPVNKDAEVLNYGTHNSDNICDDAIKIFVIAEAIDMEPPLLFDKTNLKRIYAKRPIQLRNH